MEFRIQQANCRHRLKIAELIVEGRIGEDSLAKQLVSLICSRAKYWFVRADGKIVGCVGADLIGGSRSAVLTHLVVEEEYRKQGIGMALFNHAINYCRGEGADTVAFVTMYYHFRRFKKLGFRVCRRAEITNSAIRNYWMFTTKRYMKCAVMMKKVRPLFFWCGQSS